MKPDWYAGQASKFYTERR